MDRNSAIGLTLIAVLLLLYFNFFAPEPPQETPPMITTEQPDSLAQTPDARDTLSQSSETTQTQAVAEVLTQVENNDLIISFSNHGGVPRQVELKKFKTYYQKPLVLIAPGSNAFSLKTIFEGKDLDIYSLPYSFDSKQTSGTNADTKERMDSTIVTYTTTLAEGKVIRHIYSIPSNGYTFRYRIETEGLSNSLNGDQLTLLWTTHMAAQEKDVNDSRLKTSINYYTVKESFDDINDGSLEPESETVAEPVRWLSFKQKFFTSAIISRRGFTNAEIDIQSDAASLTTLKSAKVKLSIPKADLLDKKTDFQFFFGPNDYKILGRVTDGFSKNLNLGWPPVIWVNKFIIIPVFHFLESFIGNYGVIIIILVLIIRVILLPLSYSSYLGMAKMRLLKPELDLIKEKNGDNMTQTQQDQMKLYQQAGVNPFSGCIPLLLQMPILFAMFYFFPVSVELRQQPFLWANDLSTYDSILDLPFTIPFYGDHVSLWVLLMTASNIVMALQNNQLTSATGPMKSMGYIMPLIFMFVLNNFSAGLSFYYFVANVVTFGQQAIIKRFVDEDKIKAVMDDHKKKMTSGTGGKKSKFMTKLEEAMKASEEARKKKG